MLFNYFLASSNPLCNDPRNFSAYHKFSNTKSTKLSPKTFHGIHALQALSQCLCKSVCVFICKQYFSRGAVLFLYTFVCTMNFMLACTHMNLFWSEFYNEFFYCSSPSEKSSAKLFVYFVADLFECGLVVSKFLCTKKFIDKILKIFNIDWWLHDSGYLARIFIIEMWNGYLT